MSHLTDRIDSVPNHVTKQFGNCVDKTLSDFDNEQRMLMLLLYAYVYYHKFETDRDWVDYQIAIEELYNSAISN